MESKPANEAIHSRRAARPSGRPTIGLIIESITDDRATSLWAGAMNAARQMDANLLCFPILFRQQANRALYDLVDASDVDGRIIQHWWTSRQEFEDVHSHWRPTPVVNIMRSYEGYPGVMVDDYQGMRDQVRHLIEVHGYRRIAFVRGSQGTVTAEARFRAYRDALKEQGLSFEPALVAPGDYAHDDGVRAVRSWLDQSKLRVGMDLQAIVASNDDMAQGVLDELSQRGVQVPYDIAVTGFDNNPWAEITVPPLTTVTVPYHEIGQRAVEVILAHLQGKPAPAQSLVPTRLVVRRSCGCFSTAVMQTSVQVAGEPPASWEAALAAQRDQIQAEMVQATGAGAEDWHWAGELIESFTIGVQAKSNMFLQQLDQALRRLIASGGDVLAWQGAISVLRRHTRPYLEGEALLRAQDLWEQARVMIGEMARQAQVRAQLQAEQQAQALHALDQVLATSPDRAELMDTLYERLPALGVSSCYLSLYETPNQSTEYARLVLAYNEQGRIMLDPDGRRFPSHQLVPEGLLPQDKPYSLVVEPLSFHEQRMGFVLFGTDLQDKTMYETLRGQISSALRGALILQERKQVEETLERERNLLRALIDNIPDRIYAKDTQSRFIIANLASARRMGRSSPDELVGKSDFDFVPRELAERFYADEQAIIRTGEPLINREEPLEKSADGQVTRWNLATKVPLRDSQGNIIGIVGLGREITDLKRGQVERERLLAEVQRRALQFQAGAEVSRAASSILEPDELMRQAVNLIRDRFGLYYVGLFLLDPDKRYAELRAGTGEAGQQMLAQRHKLEVGGASMIGWCIANRQARIALDVGEEAVRFSNPLLAATRSELALPLVSRGQVIGALTVQSDRAAAFDQDDITILQTMADQIANAIENARLYKDLVQEQYLMESLLNNVPDYIYFKDTHSRFIRASQALARSFGLSDSALLVGKTDFDFFTEAHARPAYEDEQRIIQTGQPLMNKEEKETRPNRPDAWVLTTKMPLRDQDGKIIGTFGISKDITDLKLAETQAREALRELERLYRITSREGWQALRETTQLVPGYLFDRTTLQPRPDLWMPQIEQAVEQNTFVPPTGEQAVAVAPLAVRGEVIGAVGVYDDPEHPLSAEELDLVQQITEQGALALESARLFEQTQASLAEARALYHFSEVVSRETDLQMVYDAVSRLLMEELGYVSAWLTVLDEDGRMLKGVAGAGPHMTEESIRMTLPISETSLPVAIAARERTTIVINESLSDKRLADLPSTVRAELGKAIATPILVGDELKGVILATRSQAGAHISPRDERLLQAVASQVAVAIQRAQLFEQTRAALAEVEATHRRYLRQEWETFLATLDKPMGFVDGPAGVTPASEIWLPEMEQALEQGEPVVASAQRAALAVPLKLRGEPIGALEFYEEGQPHAWNDDERALVQALADQAVLALENARLFEETQARAQREQLINAITARIRASMDMETVLKTTAQELSRTLNLSRARIRLKTGDGKDDLSND